MTPKSWKQTLAINILPNISRSKANKTMEFGQLIEHNMRNIFLENITQNMVKKLFSDPFMKKQN